MQLCGRGKDRQTIEVYTGCSNNCTFCQHADQNIGICPRRQAVREVLEQSRFARGLKQKPTTLSLGSDPYQPIDDKFNATADVIRATYSAYKPTKIISKGGNRLIKGFYTTLERPAYYEYGTILVYADDATATIHEPGAASTSERIYVNRVAHDLGFKTFVVLDPIISISDAFNLIIRTYKDVDYFQIGGMCSGGAIGSQEIVKRNAVEAYLKKLGCDYIVES